MDGCLFWRKHSARCQWTGATRCAGGTCSLVRKVLLALSSKMFSCGKACKGEVCTCYWLSSALMARVSGRRAICHSLRSPCLLTAFQPLAESPVNFRDRGRGRKTAVPSQTERRKRVKQSHGRMRWKGA